MARSDIPIWTFTGIFIGMIASAFVNPSYTIIGAIAGGVIGYLLGKNVT